MVSKVCLGCMEFSNLQKKIPGKIIPGIHNWTLLQEVS